ncbi:hypothetical protein ebA5769 [Aromatoleum aromaticum EbN1]|uniref:Uncharacterized protein n=1 Tax=Aromatoleum aromaticum (strain DSM 19018 / LMG 30748 / EbN1) TaxID=76114 RepID=Q5NZW3_AROAE|nr:hypothetical protein ebA5769 [Aromatoleum aromaticum EbN1]
MRSCGSPSSFSCATTSPSTTKPYRSPHDHPLARLDWSGATEWHTPVLFPKDTPSSRENIRRRPPDKHRTKWIFCSRIPCHAIGKRRLHGRNCPR